MGSWRFNGGTAARLDVRRPRSTTPITTPVARLELLLREPQSAEFCPGTEREGRWSGTGDRRPPVGVRQAAGRPSNAIRAVRNRPACDFGHLMAVFTLVRLAVLP